MTDANQLSRIDALIDAGRASEALTILRRAAAASNATANYMLAFWHLVGRHVPRNLASARHFLRTAASLGHEEAAIVEASLIANGSGGERDWKAAMNRLREAAARGNGSAAAQLLMLDTIKIDDDGDPTIPNPIERLTADGLVSCAPGLLSPEECNYLIGSAQDIMSPALVVDPRTGREIVNPVRTSETGVISPVREDLVIRAINLRIAKITQTHVDSGEALTLLRYKTGQEFKLHYDILHQPKNQREKTVIIYLNDDFSGGETFFPDYRLTVTPKQGNALIFSNVMPDNSQNKLSRHAGLPVTKGSKWVATRWIRSRPFDVWQGPETV